MADEMFSAKQVARRIGTDGKTFRKWLRSPASPYDAVGQGQRYEFPQKDLAKINKAFHAWKSRSARRAVVQVNGHSKPVPEGFIKPKIRTDAQFKAEVAARAAARDAEYNTVDGEEPTEHELWLIEQDTTDWTDDDERWVDASPSGHLDNP